ncbi:MAG: ADP-forming succinate--CoA ligase subunit beta, partial [bacterium]
AAAEKIGGRVVIKAQVHAGGRGKAGGIQIADTPEEAEQKAVNILGMKIKGMHVCKVLVTRAVEIQKEYYAGIILDRSQHCAVLLVSIEGGVDIEEVAARSPEKIGRVQIDPLSGVSDYALRWACYGAGIPLDESPKVQKILAQLCRCFFEIDATLAEINPLCLTPDGEFVAVDCKIDLDDNALFRHPELKELKEESEEDEIEREAHRRGLAYVRLDGEIGVIGNGAGLVMATLDMVTAAGSKPANFLDIGGGARAEVVKNAMEIILMDSRVRGILINVFGGITRCDEVARGIVEAAASMSLSVPIVIRLKGTREKEGLEILREAGFESAATVQEAAKKIVALSKSALCKVHSAELNKAVDGKR